jgi:hypothetical protein
MFSATSTWEAFRAFALVNFKIIVLYFKFNLFLPLIFTLMLILH